MVDKSKATNSANELIFANRMNERLVPSPLEGDDAMSDKVHSAFRNVRGFADWTFKFAGWLAA
jgi:hypothetical protein